MSATNFNTTLIEICTVLGLGRPQGTPAPVSGGLLHRMWRFGTDKGTFAMKVLNEEIMARPEARRNYRLSEKIASFAHLNGIPAVLSKVVGGDPWVELNGHSVMVFDWIEGDSVSPENCTEEHAKSIGQVLFQLHNLDMKIDDLDPPPPSTIPEETWSTHIARAQQTGSCWGFPCDTLLDDVMNWSRSYEGATETLGERFVISHRDLDSKNVIWATDKTPVLIDWESAGFTHPTVELVEGAINWSRNTDGTCDKRRFQALIQAYLGAGGEIYTNSLKALYGTLGGRLGWLEYNMRRSVDSDVFDTDEREIGKRQVCQSIRELLATNALYREYAMWIDELR